MKKKDQKVTDLNDNDIVCKITPKGIAWIALEDAGIDATLEQLEAFWTSFVKYMKKNGYVKKK